MVFAHLFSRLEAELESYLVCKPEARPALARDIWKTYVDQDNAESADTGAWRACVCVLVLVSLVVSDSGW